ncbi:hypothetical protein PR202_ga04277 [Eleusine coracana subsp. coracana]|uniref:Uncharacterized protein n=1 Tax=Eleusine coracana subsp. coracana TaxID=191504 RepID=A0AAV5BQR7_ELECO|nr:hypothetical protein PR202_ga04277 [Eleusine coracana subsp. coracana]
MGNFSQLTEYTTKVAGGVCTTSGRNDRFSIVELRFSPSSSSPHGGFFPHSTHNPFSDKNEREFVQFWLRQGGTDGEEQEAATFLAARLLERCRIKNHLR